MRSTLPAGPDPDALPVETRAMPLTDGAPLDHLTRQWRLAPDGDPFETESSWLAPVRRRGVPAMLKAFKPTSDERDSAAVLRYFDGVGAVSVLAANESGLLLERLDENAALATMALSGRDDDAAEVLASVVMVLHLPRSGPRPSRLIALGDWFGSLLDHETDLPILGRCARLARDLLATSREEVVLHGDLHHRNVLGGPRGWLAIDPKGLIGERTYEVANLLGNPFPAAYVVHRADRMRRQAELYASRLDLDFQRVLGFAFVHAGLAATWSMGDGTDPRYRLRCAEILDDLLEQGR